MTSKLKSTAPSKLTEIAGWYGAGAILLAYALVSTGAVLPRSWQYQALNLTGSLGILAISLARRAKQPAVLNIVWATVAFVSLASMLLK
jgi:hypothetical protein